MVPVEDHLLPVLLDVVISPDLGEVGVPIADRAEQETIETNEAIQGLASSGDKIGDVLKLISEIALISSRGSAGSSFAAGNWRLIQI